VVSRGFDASVASEARDVAMTRGYVGDNQTESGGKPEGVAATDASEASKGAAAFRRGGASLSN